MEIKITSCTKSVSEKYNLEFNNGDYANFTIDKELGEFVCHSSYGVYGYTWTAFGDDFKKFLRGLNEDYLLTKLCCKSYFNVAASIEKWCRELELYKAKGVITEAKFEGTKVFLRENLKCVEGIQTAICLLKMNFVIRKILEGCSFYESEFCPEYEYTPKDSFFVYNIYPQFVEVLRQELQGV